MGEWKPLFWSLGVVLVLGLLLPLILQDYLNIEDYEISGFLTPLVNVIENGISLFGFQLNIFGFLGEGFKTFIINQLLVFAIIPKTIAIPLIILILAGIVYTILKLLPTT